MVTMTEWGLSEWPGWLHGQDGNCQSGPDGYMTKMGTSKRGIDGYNDRMGTTRVALMATWT